MLREAILSADFKPGDRLLQDELAERLNVSPTPVREALRQLEAEGIVNYSQHKGVRVAEVSPEEVHEIYLMRGALESLATRLAIPNLTKSDVNQMRKLQTKIEKAVAANELSPLRRLNYDLHMIIYNASGMQEICRVIRTLWTRFPWDTLHVLPGRAAESALEHKEIIQAISDGNDQLAGQLMQKHIDSGAKAVEAFLNRERQADKEQADSS
jgi:DNA-binding GntR family transcriptional regulator